MARVEPISYSPPRPHAGDAFPYATIEKSLWLLAVVVGLAFTLWYGLARPYMHDDSVFLMFSEVLANGQNPYQYYDNKLPGTFVLLGGFMDLVGHHVWTGRIFSWLLMILTSVIAAAALPRSFNFAERRWTALLTFVLLWFCEGSLVMTEAGVALFFVIGLWCLKKDFANARGLAAAGACFALAAQFKQNAYGLPIALGAVLFIAALAKQESWKRCFMGFGLHLAAFIAVTAACWLIYGYYGIADTLWQRAFVALGEYDRRWSLSSGVVLALRTGWFLVPAALIVLLRLATGKLWKDDPRLLFCIFTAAGLSLSLLKRPYTHYLMMAVPAVALVLAYGWAYYLRGWRPNPRKVLAYGLPALIALLLVFGAGAWIKRNSLARIAGFTEQTDTAALSARFREALSSPEDHAIFFNEGPNGIKPTAMYYYTGIRPPWPFFFFHNVPHDILQPWFDRLPQMLRDEHLKIVTFNPELHYHPYYSPIANETREAMHQVLLEEYERAPEFEDSWVWMRKNETENSANGTESAPLAGGPYN